MGLLSGFCRAAQSFLSETFQRFLEGIARDLPVLVVFLQPGSRPARHAMFETGIPKGLHPASAAKLDHCRLRVLALAMTFVEGNRDGPGGSFRDPDQRRQGFGSAGDSSWFLIRNNPENVLGPLPGTISSSRVAQEFVNAFVNLRPASQANSHCGPGRQAGAAGVIVVAAE
mgnify:CR=1 FL=1